MFRTKELFIIVVLLIGNAILLCNTVSSGHLLSILHINRSKNILNITILITSHHNNTTSSVYSR